MREYPNLLVATVVEESLVNPDTGEVITRLGHHLRQISRTPTKKQLKDFFERSYDLSNFVTKAWWGGGGFLATSSNKRNYLSKFAALDINENPLTQDHSFVLNGISSSIRPVKAIVFESENSWFWSASGLEDSRKRTLFEFDTNESSLLSDRAIDEIHAAVKELNRETPRLT